MSSQYAGVETVLQVPNTSLFVQGQDKGQGLLSIEESCVCWTSDEHTDIMTLHYPSISLHAISHDTSTFPHSCLYLLYCPSEEESDDSSIDEDEGSPLEKITEMRFVPPLPDDLQRIYSALCECQSLYPDPELSSDSEAEFDEDENNDEDNTQHEDSTNGLFFTSAEEGLPHLSAEGRANLERLEQIIQLPNPDEFLTMISAAPPTINGQFEDVDEDDDYEPN